MFDEVSPRYDVINDVLTVGNDRLWRIATTKAVAPRKGMRILDLAAGTGTSSAALAVHGAEVVAADFSEGMLAEGRKRHADTPQIEFVWADAMALPFDDNSFDAATISFGLRNISDPKQAIAEMRRVVKPGGRVVIAEFSTPPSAIVRGPYAFYGRHILPRIAGAINRDAAEAYTYLTESIEAWPAQDELASWLRDAGLERVAYRNLTFGIVALHRGFVPRDLPRAAAAPSDDASSAAAPAAKKPAAKKPAAKKPAAKKPAAKAPAAKKPAAKAAASSTSDAKTPAAKTPAAKKSAAKAPAAQKPAAKSPAAKKPAAKKPAAKTSATGTKSSAASKSATATKPATKTPAAKTPATTKKPAASESSAPAAAKAEESK